VKDAMVWSILTDRVWRRLGWFVGREVKSVGVDRWSDPSVCGRANAVEKALLINRNERWSIIATRKWKARPPPLRCRVQWLEGYIYLWLVYCDF
jgi:hypothetical protein